MRNRSRLFVAVTLALATATAAAGAPTEATFHDPVTGKSGRYTLELPAGGAKGKGLLVFFHGSGGGPTYAASFPELARLASAHKLAALAVQAPDGNVSWADAETGPRSRHDAYVDSLLRRVAFEDGAGLERQRTVFVGLSAGSTFLSGDFLPRFGVGYEGGAVLLCGGAAPVSPTLDARGKLPEAFRRRFRFWAHIETGDFLYGQTMAGLAYWRGRGAVIVSETPPGTGHCHFDVTKELERGLKGVLD